jgi:ribonuclease P protein subunit RPR2
MAWVRSERKRIASRRIRKLFEMALKIYHDEPELANNYVNLARKMGMRYKVRIPKEYRLLICAKCKRFIIPGSNSRVRLQQRREPHVVITCLRCGGYNRIPIRRKNPSK